MHLSSSPKQVGHPQVMATWSNLGGYSAVGESAWRVIVVVLDFVVEILHRDPLFQDQLRPIFRD